MLVGGRRSGAWHPRRQRGAVRAPRSVAAVVAAGCTTVAFVAPVIAPVVVGVDAGAAGATFVVNSVGDQPDAATGDGICRISGAARCTLRAAIQQANAAAGHNRIEFSIPGAGPHQIRPASAYPIITDPAGVTIDGYTQSGAAANTASRGSNAVIKIELRGTGPAGIDGLYMQSAHNVIRGLALFDFKRTIYFHGSNAHDNEVVGNFIGTNAPGTFGQPTRVINSTGVHLERGASGNRIGTAGNSNRNVISGNGDRGVGIFDDDSDGNTIRNNVIGLSPDGARLRNWGHGVDINYNASNNVVGGSAVAERNVVSGNQLSGIEISHNRLSGNTGGNRVTGNLIGTDLTGNLGNAVTRNLEFGVNLEGKASCPTVSSCGPDISANIVEANTIVGSSAGVMVWKGAHDNIVRNNRIGLLANGTIAPSSVHTLWGVLIEAGAFDNLVETNTIAGVGDGIQVRPDNDYTNLSSNPDIPTFGNMFRRNSIFSVNGFGIDIAPIGVINDTPGELDPDLQGGITPPVFTSTTVDRVVVTTCARCTVELFTTEPGGTAAHMPGRSFVALRRATSKGVATFTFRTKVTDPLVVAFGDRVTATTTDRAGNTSEFAARRTVTAGSLGGPGRGLQPARRCGTRC